MHLDLLAAAAPFTGVEADHLRELAGHVADLSLPASRVLFAHGDPADAVYLVLEGSLTLYRDQVGKPMQLLARVAAGELVGEMCLFSEERRTATARCATACRLLRVDREAMRRLLARDPRLALHVQNTAARRRNLNAAAALELGNQSEVRIRLAAPVRIRLGSGATLPVELQNLSLGGLSLAGAPADWALDAAVEFELLADEEPLPIHGRIAWRDGDVVGVACISTVADHDRHVYRLLRRLGG